MANKLFAFFIALFVILGACESKASADLTLTNVQPSVYKVRMYDADGDILGSGTAWKYAEQYFMTAGHVCDGVAKLRLIDVFDREYPVLSFDGVLTDELDFCFLEAPGVPGQPLKMTLDEPSRYSRIMWVGAPLGIYGNGAAPGSAGTYVGGDMCILPGSGPGSSGSPVFTKDGVFGVLIEHARGIELAKVQSLMEVYVYLMFY